MIRFLIRTLVFLASAAIGLWVTSLVVDGVTVQLNGYLITVAIFAVAQSILTPFIAKVVSQNARAFLGGVGLLSTFVALLLASFFGDSLVITGGVLTWVGATVLTWLFTAVATLLLPLALVKAGVERARNSD
ncbi:MAG: hypothetical protein E6Q27_04750 [Aeromicrobium sp.]|nr:MAG: hypothetical protein E6Q27_04750 [Aeromicrobium sp.]